MIAFVLQPAAAVGQRDADRGPHRLQPLPLRRRSQSTTSWYRTPATRTGETSCVRPRPQRPGHRVQFGRFLANAAHGEFGVSYRRRQPVVSAATSPNACRRPWSSASPRRFRARRRRARWASTPACTGTAGRASCCSPVSLVGVSLPTFLIGILLILIFSVQLGWLPGFGRGDVVHIGWWSTGFLTRSAAAGADPAGRSRWLCSR